MRSKGERSSRLETRARTSTLVRTNFKHLYKDRSVVSNPTKFNSIWDIISNSPRTHGVLSFAACCEMSIFCLTFVHNFQWNITDNVTRRCRWLLTQCGKKKKPSLPEFATATTIRRRIGGGGATSALSHFPNLSFWSFKRSPFSSSRIAPSYHFFCS